VKHVCVVHNNVDESSSIGKLASWAVETALSAGLHVTVVARDLDPALRPEVDWRPLFVPPRAHAVQWAVARRTIVHAMRGVRPDVMHVYQPQVAALADTWHVEYLSRPAIEAGGLPAGTDPRSRLARTQALTVARMEDWYLRRIGSRPTALFCSPSMEQHFARLYGLPEHHDILLNPAFTETPHLAPSQAEARQALDLPPDAYVVGYLGGVDERKGYRELLSAMVELPADTILLMAGPGSEGFSDPALGPRVRSLGMLSDMSEFWAAVDVLAVPSRFEPFGMVVTEAAVRRRPVVVTTQVGASALVSHHSAGEVAGVGALASAISKVRDQGDGYMPGLQALVREVTSKTLSGALVKAWSAAHARNN
jgi:glycosyltransferase involved in cell wall biosynthesis